jgi:hypothetical protein
LPFVSKDEFSMNSSHLAYGRRQHQHYFHFSFEPQNCQEWKVHPGLTVLFSQSPKPCFDTPSDIIQKRPVLHGFIVDTELLTVDMDMTEFVLEFGADNLKDVPVTLFVNRVHAETKGT